MGDILVFNDKRNIEARHNRRRLTHCRKRQHPMTKENTRIRGSKRDGRYALCIMCEKIDAAGKRRKISPPPFGPL